MVEVCVDLKEKVLQKVEDFARCMGVPREKAFNMLLSAGYAYMTEARKRLRKGRGGCC